MRLIVRAKKLSVIADAKLDSNQFAFQSLASVLSASSSSLTVRVPTVPFQEAVIYSAIQDCSLHQGVSCVSRFGLRRSLLPEYRYDTTTKVVLRGDAHDGTVDSEAAHRDVP